MELKMNSYQLPKKILFNYEELKQELTEKGSMYETLVYTDDQIKEAKADKANLNRLKKALNDERIRLQKEYMQPFDDFKKKIDEIISIIDKPVAVIDQQVKAYEDKKKQEKLDAVKELWDSMEHPEELTFEKVFEDKFLNASTSMTTVKQYFTDDIKRFNRDMETLATLPEFSFEAQQMYISCLNLNDALNEAHRLSQMAKKKAEMEAEKQKTVVVGTVTAEINVDGQKVPVAEIPVEAPAKQWVRFQALMTTEDALALRDFFNSRNIEFKPL